MIEGDVCQLRAGGSGGEGVPGGDGGAGRPAVGGWLGWLVGDDSEPFLAGSFACRVVGFFFFNFFPLEFRDVENLLVDSGAFLFFLPFIFSLKPPDRLFFFFFFYGFSF